MRCHKITKVYEDFGWGQGITLRCTFVGEGVLPPASYKSYTSQSTIYMLPIL